MRILQVRFKNLNSLVGEWNIDLAHPAFTTDGIFAITWLTGAGKTTILDAICLALYGKQQSSCPLVLEIVSQFVKPDPSFLVSKNQCQQGRVSPGFTGNFF